jgi:hypothetical protein
MSLTEQQLREHLAAAACEAGEPRFALNDITSEVRRRRGLMTALATAGLAAVVALAIAIPLSLGGTREGPAPARLGSPAIAPQTKFIVSVNGRLTDGPAQTFNVPPGQPVRIEVEIIVPNQLTITDLWIGISTGTYGFARTKGTYGNVGVRPVGIEHLLGRFRTPLAAGRHTVTVQWTAPSHPGRSAELPLAADWTFTSPGPPYEGAIAAPIAEFAISPG